MLRLFRRPCFHGGLVVMGAVGCAWVRLGGGGWWWVVVGWSLQQQAVVFYVAANDKKKTAEIFRPHSLIAVHSVRASGKAVGVVIRSTSIGRPLDLHVYVPAHVRTCTACMYLQTCK
jgi:hypothetical protein